MSNFIRILSSFFKGTGKLALLKSKTGPSFESAGQPLNESEKIIRELSVAFAGAGQLLVHPTPAVIRDISLLLEEATVRLQQLKSTAQEDEGRFDAEKLNDDLRKFRCLVEGARRVQWSRMRTVIALTQSYAPGGKVSRWQPTSPKVNLQV